MIQQQSMCHHLLMILMMVMMIIKSSSFSLPLAVDGLGGWAGVLSLNGI